jgi:hypothetical protein
MRPQNVIDRKTIEKKKNKKAKLEESKNHKKRKEYELQSQKHLTSKQINNLDTTPIQSAILEQQKEILKRQSVILAELGVME